MVTFLDSGIPTFYGAGLWIAACVRSIQSSDHAELKLLGILAGRIYLCFVAEPGPCTRRLGI